MLLDSFQKLDTKTRKSYYLTLARLLSRSSIARYPSLAKEISEGNEHKVGIIRAVINTKIGTSLSWEGCLAAVNDNI